MLRMAICDGLTAWAVGLPLLATALGSSAWALARSPPVWLIWCSSPSRCGSRYRHGFSLTLVPLAAVVAASVPAWIVADALGKDLLALLASVALGELIYVAIMLVCRPIILDAVELAAEQP